MEKFTYWPRKKVLISILTSINKNLSTMSTIKIGIADDHSLFREGVRMILAGMEGISLGLEAESGEDLLRQLETQTADIILLDIEMKDINGVEALKRISSMQSKPKIIVLS